MKGILLFWRQVKGRRLDVEGAIRTRSRAAAQAEEWQVVSARVKIFSLLADMLIEAREGARSPTLLVPLARCCAACMNFWCPTCSSC